MHFKYITLNQCHLCSSSVILKINVLYKKNKTSCDRATYFGLVCKVIVEFQRSCILFPYMGAPHVFFAF